MFDKLKTALLGVRNPEIAWDETGATAVEYALMTGFIVAVIAAAVGALGTQVLALFAIGVAALP